MSFKTILTYLPSHEMAQRIVKVGLPIGEDHGSHVIGLHIVPVLPISLPLYPAGEIPIPDDVVEKQKASLVDDANAVQAEFDRAAQPFNVKSEWRCHHADYGEFARSIIDQGRCADLIVIGKGMHDPYNTGSDLTARIILESGRPTLVLPNKDSDEKVGRNVLIAWDGGRESSRAAFDALPILKKAKVVRVVMVNPKAKKVEGQFEAGEEIALGLARHEVKVEVMVVSASEHNVGDALVEKASEVGGDLLVMGCYGHSRVRELFFGGATKEILNRLPLPVMMSH